MWWNLVVLCQIFQWSWAQEGVFPWCCNQWKMYSWCAQCQGAQMCPAKEPSWENMRWYMIVADRNLLHQGSWNDNFHPSEGIWLALEHMVMLRHQLALNKLLWEHCLPSPWSSLGILQHFQQAIDALVTTNKHNCYPHHLEHISRDFKLRSRFLSEGTREGLLSQAKEPFSRGKRIL